MVWYAISSHVVVCTPERRRQPNNTNTRSRSNTREQHLDGRDLGGTQIQLVTPVAPLAERVNFQDHPAPSAPEQVMRVVLMVLKAVEALEQPLVDRFFRKL